MINLIFFVALVSLKLGKIYCLGVSDEELIEGIQIKQVFKPMSQNVHYTPEKTSTFMPETSQTLKEERKKKISDCGPLAKSFEHRPYGQEFEKIGRVLPIALSQLENGSNELENILIDGLIQKLQAENLNESIRIGYLAFLWLFLENSPLWTLKVMNTDIKEGALCRATLELSLTKSTFNMAGACKYFDLISEAKKVSKVLNIYSEINPPWLEGLRRGDVLEYIRRYRMEAPHIQPSASLVAVHDALLQASCPMEDNIAAEMTSNCIKFLNEGDVFRDREEWKCHYVILAHLIKFIPSSKQKMRQESKENVVFQAIFERMMRWQVVRLEIESFLSSHEPDPHIRDILLPFLSLKPVTLEHYEYIITVFESGSYIKKKAKALNVLKGRTKGRAKPDLRTNYQARQKFKLKSKKTKGQQELPFESEHYIQDLKEYFEDQDFVVNILYVVSPDVLGARELLDERIERAALEVLLRTCKNDS
ncbi:hypothetical protein DFH28DRAFT_932289 [Melampsora americana]|nr:hypothetical protein DFH28DRAFT_932289 [Melampsora americana]